jgi:hypothetical protein
MHALLQPEMPLQSQAMSNHLLRWYFLKPLFHLLPSADLNCRNQVAAFEVEYTPDTWWTLLPFRQLTGSRELKRCFPRLWFARPA